MGSVYKIITPPSVEPITLTDTKAYLNVDFSSKDAIIAALITRARAYAENITGRALASQQIQQVDTIERPDGGVLSGPIKPGPNWYVYNEQLGANPFGPAQYYHDLSRPPIQASRTISVQTKITAFDPWVDFDITNTFIDDTSEPARFYFQDPITANFWKFVYWTGYDSTYSYAAAPELLQAVYELISYWFDYRDGGGDANRLEQIQGKLLAKRVDWI